MDTVRQPGQGAPTDSVGEQWEIARKRVQSKRDFSGHLAAYVVVNAFLVFVWYITNAGYFWPGWVMAGWGIGLVLHGWDAFFRRPVTDADIREEMRRSHLG